MTEYNMLQYNLQSVQWFLTLSHWSIDQSVSCWLDWINEADIVNIWCSCQIKCDAIGKVIPKRNWCYYTTDNFASAENTVASKFNMGWITSERFQDKFEGNQKLVVNSLNDFMPTMGK